MVHGSTDWTDFLRTCGHDIDLSAADNWPRFASVLLHMTCGCSTKLTSNNNNTDRNINNNKINNNNNNYRIVVVKILIIALMILQIPRNVRCSKDHV